MSNKLTNKVREEIIAKAVSKSGINDRQEELRLRRAEWAENVRVAALGGQKSVAEIEAVEAQIDQLIDKLPETVRVRHTFVKRDFEIYRLNVAGLRVRAQFNGTESPRMYGFEVVYKIAPSDYTLLADDPLTAEFHAIHDAQQAIEKQREEIEASVRAAVSSVTTVKKLLEIWPEASELIPETVTPTKQLPALPREDLNAMIGLPSA